eukprot:44441_1
MAAARRLLRECNQWKQRPNVYPLIINIKKKDSLNWIVDMKGCDNTPFEDGIYSIDIKFPDSYPFQKPQIICTTPILSRVIQCNQCYPWNPSYTYVSYLSTIWKNCCRKIHRSLQKLFRTNSALYISAASTMNNIYASGPYYIYPPISIKTYNRICSLIPFYMSGETETGQTTVPQDIISLVCLFFGSTKNHCDGFSYICIAETQQTIRLWDNIKICRNEFQNLIDLFIQKCCSVPMGITTNGKHEISNHKPIKIRVKAHMIRDSGYGTVVNVYSNFTTLDLKQKIIEMRNDIDYVEQLTLYPADIERFRSGAHLASFQFNDKLNDNDSITNIPETKQWGKYTNYKYRDNEGNFLIYYFKQHCICSMHIVNCFRN